MVAGDLTLDKLMEAHFGEDNQEIRVSFKKTINTKQYESEVIQLDTTLKLDREVTGIERMAICAILEVQLEYEAYTNLVFKGIVTPTEWVDRGKQLIDAIEPIMNKYQDITGKDFNSLLDFINSSEKA